MALQALLLTKDAETLRLTRRALDEMNIACETSASPEMATEHLAKRRFDAVIIDCDDLPGALATLRGLRQSPSNKRSMAFAIVNGKTTVRDAFDLGANFVLDKPLTLERIMRSMKAAHGLMMRERRRYYRNPLTSSVFVYTSDGKERRAQIVNLSEGGMAVKAGGEITGQPTLKVRFELPGSQQRIEAKAEICWREKGNTAGLRFLHMEPSMQRDLEAWIGKQVSDQKATIFINATSGRAR